MATIQSTIRVRDAFSSPLDRFIERINVAKERQEQLNNSMRSNSTDSFANSLRRVVSAYSLLTATQRLVNLSDDFTLATSRLSLLTSEIKNMNGQFETTAQLQEKIYDAAQRSRGAYMDMMGSVSKLGMLAGDAFSNTDEIVAFTETLNKAFAVGGTGSREKSMAMYQLTQAMASGRLQGDEFRSILENAPMVADAIENYMRNVMKAEGTMKDWSSQGMLTAEVIKNAVFSASDNINAKFKTIPYTWGQVWTMCKNTFIRVMQPVLSFINLIANNWSIIAPILATIITLLGLYLIRVYALNAALRVWAAIQAVVTALTAGGLISILALMALVVGGVYLIVAAYNRWTGSSISATGIIVGGIYVILAVLYNLWAFYQNMCSAIGAMTIALGSNIVTAFKNSIANVQAFFCKLLSTALSVISKIASALNKLPFVKIDTAGLASASENYAAKASELQASKGEYKNILSEGMNAFTNGKEYKNLYDAYDKGYSKGSNLFGNLFGGLGGYDTGAFKNNGLANGLNNALNNIADNTGGTNKNTKNTADAVTKSTEDLKWLRTLVEREAINKFTTAEIKVDMGGIQNTVNKNMDLDGMVAYLEETLTEKMVSVAEGTHI